MSDNTEDRRLPETWEEFQRARRVAYVRGAVSQCVWAADEAEALARRCYPIVRMVPRTIYLASGGVARATVDGVEIEGFEEVTARAILLRTGTVQALAELVKHPTEEVAE